jgi:hypothetical protein
MAGLLKPCKPQAPSKAVGQKKERQMPHNCKTCRLDLNGKRYRIYSDGSVSSALTSEEIVKMGFVRLKDTLRYEETSLIRYLPDSEEAQEVRREALRQRLPRRYAQIPGRRD